MKESLLHADEEHDGWVAVFDEAESACFQTGVSLTASRRALESLESSGAFQLSAEPWLDQPSEPSLGFESELALRNLADDPWRLLIGLLGVAFAAFLMTVQVGLLLGFLDTTTALIAHSPGDLWIVPRGTLNLETVDPQPERNHHLAAGTPGVGWSGRLLAGWSSWKNDAGQPERVFVFGVDPERPVGLPWSMDVGQRESIFTTGGVIVDQLDRGTLGGRRRLQLGDQVELAGHRSRVVGFTHDVRSFTTFPYVFTSLDHARDVVVGPDGAVGDMVHYVVVGLAPGADLARTQAALQAALPDSEVLTRDGFRWRTGGYWLVDTGVGSMCLLAAVLGLLVGAAVVGQTIYSQTMERLPEYGTLKALGATDAELGRLILVQALVTGSLGFVLGLGAALLVAQPVNQGRLLILLGPLAPSALGLITLATSALTSVLSVRHVARLEPADAFRG